MVLAFAAALGSTREVGQSYSRPRQAASKKSNAPFSFPFCS